MWVLDSRIWTNSELQLYHLLTVLLGQSIQPLWVSISSPVQRECETVKGLGAHVVVLRVK